LNILFAVMAMLNGELVCCCY